MGKKNKKDGMRFYVREFLNKPHNYAGAYVLLSVKDTSLVENDHHAWSDISCEIADCSERIHLQFDLADATDRRNSIAKAEMLVRVFTGFAAAIRLEATEMAAREKRLAKEKREKEKRGEEDEPGNMIGRGRLRDALRRARTL